VDALRTLGGEASLSEIYACVAHQRSPLPKTWQAIIRNTIESHSSDSDNFRSEDLFYSSGGRGSGRWGLR
jgi:hypothetical protein